MDNHAETFCFLKTEDANYLNILLIYNWNRSILYLKYFEPTRQGFGYKMGCYKGKN